MSPWLSERPHGLRLSAVKAMLKTSVRPASVFVSGATAEAALDAFTQWAERHQGSTCEVALSSALVKVCVVPADAGHLSQQEMLDYAQLQFDHYFAQGGQPNDMQWALAASKDVRVPLIFGTEQRLIDAIQDAARANWVRIQRVIPWWVRGVETVLNGELAVKPEVADGVAIAAVEPSRTTLVMVRHGRVMRVFCEASVRADDWFARLGSAFSIEMGNRKAACWQFNLGEDQQQTQVIRGRVDYQPVPNTAGVQPGAQAS